MPTKRFRKRRRKSRRSKHLGGSAFDSKTNSGSKTLYYKRTGLHAYVPVLNYTDFDIESGTFYSATPADTDGIAFVKLVAMPTEAEFEAAQSLLKLARGESA